MYRSMTTPKGRLRKGVKAIHAVKQDAANRKYESHACKNKNWKLNSCRHLSEAIKQPLVCTGGSNVGHNFMCIQVNVDIKPVSPAPVVRTADNMQIKCKWFIWWRWPWGCCLDSSVGSGLFSKKRSEVSWHQSFEYFQAKVNMAGNHPSSLKQGLSSAATRLGIRSLFNFHPKHVFVLSSTT